MADNKIIGIPQTGNITLEDGRLVCRQGSTVPGEGHLLGYIFVGPDGLTVDGMEMTIAQAGDPPKVRLGSLFPDDKGGGGAISAVRIRRHDCRGEELGMINLGSIDNPTGDDRGMMRVLVRGSENPDDMRVALVATSQYSEELYGGEHKTWTGLRNFQGDLWKYASASDPDHVDGPPYGTVPRFIALKAQANHQFVCAEAVAQRPLLANRPSIGPWETFEMVPTTMP